jgi:hypothetical protein
MPWPTDPEKRQRDARVYNAEYRRNREAAKRRAGGRCEQCHHKHPRLQCDHIRNVGNGPPDHSLGNLAMLCVGHGSCKCHERKTAQEGGGYRAGGREDPPVQARTQW